ncbi:MAG: superoxide dismutase [Ilumatobacteraceae bacterium]|nr:superoxide dismutase [Ilumatobacteraceae bacterium]
MATYTLPALPYAYDALSPHLSAETMELHHDKHHAAYVKAANETVERLATAEAWQIAGLERALAFNVSGHGLHTLFWESMSPEMEQKPTGTLAAAIDLAFGSVDKYIERFTAALTTIQGSGWALLVFEPIAAELQIVQVQNHDGAMLLGSTPILAADGWEHAYYVDYRNDKASWAKNFTQMTDWAGAAARFDAVVSSAHH